MRTSVSFLQFRTVALTSLVPLLRFLTQWSQRRTRLPFHLPGSLPDSLAKSQLHVSDPSLAISNAVSVPDPSSFRFQSRPIRWRSHREMDLRSLALPDRSFDRGRSLHWIRRPESVEVRKVAPSELFVSSSSVLAFSSSDRTDSLLDSLLSTLSTLPSSLTALDFLSSLLESWEWLEGTMYVRFLRFVFRTRRADSLSFGFSDSLLLHRVSFLLSSSADPI